tara:strand:+ start:198 stop:1280 length:1083 start_codon:yes stop_codon:yes gene_type:complete
MQKFISKNLFWILQLLGWGAFSLFLTFAGNISETWQGILLITLGNMFVFIFTTSLLRWVLNKFAPIKGFNVITGVKIVLAVLVTALILPTFAYYVGFGAGKISKFLFEDTTELIKKPPKEIKTIAKYVVYTIIVTGWTIFYFTIKLLRNSNSERIRRLQLKDQVRQAQLNTLKGHINPQFIFTSLNNIKGLMLEDVTKSRAMLTTLSEMLRYSLTKNNINSVSLEEELEITKNYITILEIEGKNRLTVHYEVAPETLQLQIPPMLLANLMELATRHGVLNLKEGGNIKLVAELHLNKLKISIIHTGKVILSKPRQVLENTIRQRLKLLYGPNASYMSNHEIDKNTLWVVLPVNPVKNIEA